MFIDHPSQVKLGVPLKLNHLATNNVPSSMNKELVQAQTKLLSEHLQELQWRLFGEGRRGLLVIFQAMDAGGKDGTIRAVFGGLNPQGVRVHSFKAPSEQEKAHDFLWRVHPLVPAAGEVSIFNRSHYEDVLVPWVLNHIDKQRWMERMESINDFERHLIRNGTVVLKFFLHISKAEQLARFKSRMETPAKRWKIRREDYLARSDWGKYHMAYEEVMARTSTPESPWHIIPADRTWYRNFMVADITEKVMQAMNIQLPEPFLPLDEVKALYAEELRRAELI